MFIKKVSLVNGFGLSLLTITHLCLAKTQTITVKNMTDRDIIIQIIRPAEKPCQSIQDTVAKRDTREFILSNTCPLTQFKVMSSATNSEKIISQLTYGTYTKFLIEPNQSGDDIIVTPFIAEDQGWHRKQKQARERLEQEKEEQESYIKQI